MLQWPRTTSREIHHRPVTPRNNEYLIRVEGTPVSLKNSRETLILISLFSIPTCPVRKHYNICLFTRLTHFLLSSPKEKFGAQGWRFLRFTRRKSSLVSFFSPVLFFEGSAIQLRRIRRDLLFWIGLFFAVLHLASLDSMSLLMCPIFLLFLRYSSLSLPYLFLCFRLFYDIRICNES